MSSLPDLSELSIGVPGSDNFKRRRGEDLDPTFQFAFYHQNFERYPHDQNGEFIPGGAGVPTRKHLYDLWHGGRSLKTLCAYREFGEEMEKALEGNHPFCAAINRQGKFVGGIVLGTRDGKTARFAEPTEWVASLKTLIRNLTKNYSGLSGIDRIPDMESAFELADNYKLPFYISWACTDRTMNTGVGTFLMESLAEYIDNVYIEKATTTWWDEQWDSPRGLLLPSDEARSEDITRQVVRHFAFFKLVSLWSARLFWQTRQKFLQVKTFDPTEFDFSMEAHVNDMYRPVLPLEREQGSVYEAYQAWPPYQYYLNKSTRGRDDRFQVPAWVQNRQFQTPPYTFAGPTLLGRDTNRQLLWAAYRVDVLAATMLLSQPYVNPNVQTWRGHTPLMVVAGGRNDKTPALVKIAQMLLEKGADVSLADANGKTAMMYAVEAQNTALLDVLTGAMES